VYCPYPNRDYTWFDLNVVDSPAGLVFKRKYVQPLFKCLRLWRLLART
jgi:hypothetical protein